jgi:hypothetical protein
MSSKSSWAVFAFYQPEWTQVFLHMIRHDPLAIIGLLLIGASGVLWFRLYSNLKVLGEQAPRSISLPLAFHIWLSKTYLRHAHAGHCSPWPAYLMWLCSGAGVLLLVVGLVRL